MNLSKSCIINLNPRPNANGRLFCFPYAGSSASVVYRKWTSNLSPQFEVIPIELPGRGSRIQEELKHNVQEVVEEIAGSIIPLLNKPFYFFGHSMGALISFKLANYLKHKIGMQPKILFLSAHRAPQILKTGLIMHKLNDEELKVELKNLKGMDEKILENDELMEIFLPIIKADYEVCETYPFSDNEILDIPFIVFGGDKDEGISVDELKEWKQLTTKSFQLHLFAGDHFYIMKKQEEFLKYFNNILMKNFDL